ncbi:Flavonoid 3'-hydroxylase [Abeliophyllum distichum]|uniref:Flavonoid 3'-hydroxylase n=1 Tax=Abeliophyllum distichum TaxID=126358 RepID=A0ABD1S9N3_9LAMI
MSLPLRPALAAGKYTSYNYLDMTWAPYGVIFFLVFTALSKLQVNGFGKPVLLREQLSRFSLSSLSRMVLGNKYFSESKCDLESSIITLDELQELLDQWFLHNGVINIGGLDTMVKFLGHARIC